MAAPQNIPTAEDLEDLILSCRYGDLDDVQTFVTRFGTSALDDYVDDRGNSCLHMAAANGHQDLVRYLLGQLQKPSSLFRSNLPPASNTPLHWAALNHHLPVLQLLCPRLTTAQICTLNGRGMSAMSEAMEGVSLSSQTPPSDPKAQDTQDSIPIREQCVNYLVEMMRLGDEDGEQVPSSSPDHPNPELDNSNQSVAQTHLNHDLSRPICLR